jgi:hypothetical protein
MSQDKVVTIRATPEILVRASAPQLAVTGERDPAHIVVLASSTVAGPKGDSGVDDGPDLVTLYENAKV